ncbi:hypothetical protein M0R45_006366 [Rubus argutus]|uniref:Transmembrane protein n=1 Tax=Rubus argutus TaxID=59490 RepID=A0AAW1YQC4_RUBAR
MVLDIDFWSFWVMGCFGYGYGRDGKGSTVKAVMLLFWCFGVCGASVNCFAEGCHGDEGVGKAWLERDFGD